MIEYECGCVLDGDDPILVECPTHHAFLKLGEITDADVRWATAALAAREGR